ncbi:MAG TPA: ATP-binding cassette domain-containing protein [Bacteroidales bacterium]|nr:ATP-binding cassette domain-containing protein [Bacteroidales bacterium]
MSGLHVDSVMKSFGSAMILSDVFISCEKGEIVGLVGRNGSGKSTLLKIIFGSLRADSRFVRVDDKIINGISDVKGMISYLPQHGFLPHNLTVARSLSLLCGKTDFQAVAGHKLIYPLLNKTPHQLSSGERRIVEIFSILFSSARYVLIDEPFNGVAPIFKEEIKAIIKERSTSKGFIITDHDYRNVLDISTRLILLHEGSTTAINNREDLVRFYLPE